MIAMQRGTIIPIVVPMMHFSRLVKAGSVTPMTQLHFGHLCVNFLKSKTYSFNVLLSFLKEIFILILA